MILRVFSCDDVDGFTHKCDEVSSRKHVSSRNQCISFRGRDERRDKEYSYNKRQSNHRLVRIWTTPDRAT